METTMRPWFTTGVALVGASAIALTPVAPIDTSPVPALRAVPAAVSTEFQLTALDLPYILTLPIVRQQIRNWAETWVVYLRGLGQAGVGAVDSLLALPEATVEIIREVLALDFVAAFDTITTGIRDTVVAIGQPLLDSAIWRSQKAYAVQTALQSAVPLAWIDLINGFLVAGNGVTVSLIEGVQNLVAAVLTFNLGNIIDAGVEGTRNFFDALGAGAGAIVTGIESAQLGIATALATEPPPVTLTEVSTLRTLSTDTVSLAGTSGADPVAAEEEASLDQAPEVAPAVDESPAVYEPVGSPDPVSAAPVDDEDTDPPVDPPKKQTLTTPAKDKVEDVTPATDATADATAGPKQDNDPKPEPVKDAEKESDPSPGDTPD